MKKPLKILIADDHKVVREGLVSMLKNQTEFNTIISEANNGAEVIDIMTKESFDILLLDIQMPRIDGIKTLEILRQKNDFTPVLVLSFHDDNCIVQRVMNNGANGFISKSALIEELTKAILTLIQGGKYEKNQNSNQSSYSQVGKKESLTKREIQVITLIADELSNLEIAEQMYISNRTVEYHKGNIMNKLHVKNSIGITKYAVQNGLINWSRI